MPFRAHMFIYPMLLLLVGCAVHTPQSIPRDWGKTDTRAEGLKFPKNFVWGVAASAYQTEGGDTSSDWYRWERSKKKDGRPRIAGGQVCGNSADNWHRY